MITCGIIVINIIIISYAGISNSITVIMTTATKY